MSGPGAQSRRTDGGPAQAAKDYSGGTYGERKMLADQQNAAPMAGGGADGVRTPTPGAAGGGGGAPQPVMPGDPFAPTTRPTEPGTAGMAGTAPGEAPDVDMALRMMYRQFPHPQLLQLIRQQNRRS